MTNNSIRQYSHLFTSKFSKNYETYKGKTGSLPITEEKLLTY